MSALVGCASHTSAHGCRVSSAGMMREAMVAAERDSSASAIDEPGVVTDR
jgi:hypothetical protein